MKFPRGALLLLDKVEKEEYLTLPGRKCFEYARNYQADVKMSINRENNEKLGKILYFVVGLYICFMTNAIEVL